MILDSNSAVSIFIFKENWNVGDNLIVEEITIALNFKVVNSIDVRQIVFVGIHPRNRKAVEDFRIIINADSVNSVIIVLVKNREVENYIKVKKQKNDIRLDYKITVEIVCKKQRMVENV